MVRCLGLCVMGHICSHNTENGLVPESGGEAEPEEKTTPRTGYEGENGDGQQR